MTDGAEAPRPVRSPFRRRQIGPRLSADAARRQGRITLLAFELLGGKDAALGFLNAFEPSLGGRPLDVAIASDEGLVRVQSVIETRSGRSVNAD